MAKKIAPELKPYVDAIIPVKTVKCGSTHWYVSEDEAVEFSEVPHVGWACDQTGQHFVEYNGYMIELYLYDRMCECIDRAFKIFADNVVGDYNGADAVRIIDEIIYEGGYEFN